MVGRLQSISFAVSARGKKPISSQNIFFYKVIHYLKTSHLDQQNITQVSYKSNFCEIVRYIKEPRKL